MSIFKYLTVMAFGFLAIVISDAISSRVLMSTVGKNALTVASMVSGMCLGLYVAYRPKLSSIKRFIKANPVVWCWRVLGASFVLVGFFLAIGNLSGTFVSIPYAGTVLSLVGMGILLLRGYA
jgi:hypothetical protein